MTWFHTLLPQPTTQVCNCFCFLCSNHESTTCQVKNVQGQLKLMYFSVMALLAPVKADASCAFQPHVVSFSVPWAFVWDKTSKFLQIVFWHSVPLLDSVQCRYEQEIWYNTQQRAPDGIHTWALGLYGLHRNHQATGYPHFYRSLK